MIEHTIELGDIEALAAILESEKVAHCRTRALCFGLFVFCFVTLVLATVMIAIMFTTGRMSDLSAGNWLGALQLLTPLSAAVIGFFGSWWAAQNCINSIERTLFAARSGRHQLFASFLREIQCADKKKRRMWLEVLKAFVT